MEHISSKKSDLPERLVLFTVSMIRLAHMNQSDRMLDPIFNQIIRSAGSVGANIADRERIETEIGASETRGGACGIYQNINSESEDNEVKRLTFYCF